MVLMNLSTGQQWRCRQREQTYGQGRKERVRQTESTALKHVHCLTYSRYSQWKLAIGHRELKSGALRQPRGCDGVGGVRKVQDGGDTHIPLTNSCQYMAETNTIS